MIESVSRSSKGGTRHENRVIAADWTHWRSGRFDVLAYSPQELVDDVREVLRQRAGAGGTGAATSPPKMVRKLVVDGHHYAKAGGGRSLNKNQIVELSEMLLPGAVIERHGCFAAHYPELYKPWIRVLSRKGGVYGSFTGLTVGVYGNPGRPSRPSPSRPAAECLWIETVVPLGTHPAPPEDGRVIPVDQLPPQE